MALSKEMGSGKSFFKAAVLETVKGGAFADAFEMGSGKPVPKGEALGKFPRDAVPEKKKPRPAQGCGAGRTVPP